MIIASAIDILKQCGRALGDIPDTNERYIDDYPIRYGRIAMLEAAHADLGRDIAALKAELATDAETLAEQPPMSTREAPVRIGPTLDDLKAHHKAVDDAMTAIATVRDGMLAEESARLWDNVASWLTRSASIRPTAIPPSTRTLRNSRAPPRVPTSEMGGLLRPPPSGPQRRGREHHHEADFRA